MAKYKVVSRVEIGTPGQPTTTVAPGPAERTVYEPGSTLECDDLTAAQLLESGAIEEDKGEKDKDKPKLEYSSELDPRAIPPKPSSLEGMPKPSEGSPTAEEANKPHPPGPAPAVGPEVKTHALPHTSRAPAVHTPPPLPHRAPAKEDRK
jgi:hypothetical protein